MNNLHVRKDDTVVVLSGKDKGRQGKVLATSPKNGTVIIEGIAMVSRHTKPRRQGDPGGIIEKEAAVRASKVMRVCPKCGKPTRIAHKVKNDGTKTRVCKKCSAEI